VTDGVHILFHFNIVHLLQYQRIKSSTVPEHSNFITKKVHPVTAAMLTNKIKETFCTCNRHIHINIPEELVVGTLHTQNQQ